MKIFLFLVLHILTEPFDLSFERKLQNFYRSLWSPFCPGRSLADCPTQQAENLKVEIRQMVIEGKDLKFIVSELNSRYGQNVVSYPSEKKEILIAKLPFYFFVGIVIFFFCFKARTIYRNAKH
ncbi:MAG: cytochrome c-type biogenesis protein CcmH [Deltaproteobacteria bacterium]|nr:cytochrome c-type biogenesis protein CcmH [Deltaproteobacteria bacterium]